MTKTDAPLPPFKREERYIVLKRKHMNAGQEFAVRSLLGRIDVKTVECVVVESDWPEYETVWRMIEDRVTPRATPAAPDEMLERVAELQLAAFLAGRGSIRTKADGRTVKALSGPTMDDYRRMACAALGAL